MARLSNRDRDDLIHQQAAQIEAQRKQIADLQEVARQVAGLPAIVADLLEVVAPLRTPLDPTTERTVLCTDGVRRTISTQDIPKAIRFGHPPMDTGGTDTTAKAAVQRLRGRPTEARLVAYSGL